MRVAEFYWCAFQAIIHCTCIRNSWRIITDKTVSGMYLSYGMKNVLMSAEKCFILIRSRNLLTTGSNALIARQFWSKIRHVYLNELQIWNSIYTAVIITCAISGCSDKCVFCDDMFRLINTYFQDSSKYFISKIWAHWPYRIFSWFYKFFYGFALLNQIMCDKWVPWLPSAWSDSSYSHLLNDR